MDKWEIRTNFFLILLLSMCVHTSESGRYLLPTTSCNNHGKQEKNSEDILTIGIVLFVFLSVLFSVINGLMIEWRQPRREPSI
jgi:hypothetical protein